MNKKDIMRVRRAFNEFVEIENWRQPLAITLKLTSRSRVGVYRKPLDEVTASQNLKHFQNVLNRKMLRGRAKKGFKIPCVALLERGHDVGLHYHLIMDCPAEVDPAYFRQLIVWAWAKTHFGGRIHIAECPDRSGWLRYITKLRSKPNYTDSIDWLNFHSIANEA